ncbi:hypothetical protein AB0D84_27140, partial [Streptomyces sp. NPDC048193]|uniref:hypothetical protein n=1 Tax=unclassified Streptomyces TaxID=2593676 RepID=UPI00344263A0
FMDGHKIRNRIGLVDENGQNILVAPPWRIVATGDFNSDGRPDILWQNDDGGLQIWFMDGHKIRNRIGLVDENGQNILVAPPWRIVATSGIDLTEARRLIDERYKAAGGITGPLGLPMGAVRPVADGALRPFAGGAVHVLHHGGVHGPGKTWCVMVRFLGFHCLEESDEWSASDEPYFLISVVGANKAVTRKIGPVENVDAGEDHTIVSGVAGFEDRIVPPVILGVIANENDEGSPEEAAEKAKKVAESAVGKFEEAMASFGAATTDSHVVPEWFRDILVGWIPEGVAAVFGLGDDSIGSNGQILFDYDPAGMDWRSPPSLGTFGANPYNVKLPVGVNPEEGRYELYFDVKVGTSDIDTL